MFKGEWEKSQQYQALQIPMLKVGERIAASKSNVMHEAFKKGTMNESQKYGDGVVQELFKRRNAIAHQLDRDHASAEQTDIKKEYVEERILEVAAIVEAIHKIAVEKG